MRAPWCSKLGMSVSFRDAENASGDGMLIDVARDQKGLGARDVGHAKVAPTRPVEERPPRARAAIRARRAKATIGPAGMCQAPARLGGNTEIMNSAVSATLSHPASPAGSRTSQAAATAASIKS